MDLRPYLDRTRHAARGLDLTHMMDPAVAFRIEPPPLPREGACLSFPYDRDLVRRFRDAFPRARWRPEESRWFVPGKTAETRLAAWAATEADALDRYAEARGRDAFAFEPWSSPYLEVGDDFVVRTPYSRTAIEELRAVPFAAWDPDVKAWRAPFGSADELRRRWPAIAAAAQRAEPAARKAREVERRAAANAPGAARRRADRKAGRYPLLGDDLPPFGVPVMTPQGVVMFEEAECAVDAEGAAAYPHVAADLARAVWGTWRVPTFRELAAAKLGEGETHEGLARGWWLPDRDEIDEARRRLRAAWKRAQAKASAGTAPPLTPTSSS